MIRLRGHGESRPRGQDSGEVVQAETLLEVSGLTVSYRAGGEPETPAVSGVSFAVHAGEALGLLGESGCGKTTTALSLLRILPRAARITGGAIRFRGQDLLVLGRQELEKIRGAEIAMIFQEPTLALNPVMCIGDQVVEVMRAHLPWGRRRRREEALNLLRQVGLVDSGAYYAAFPHQLSGGQRQRALIAQALACGPSLIIADEPTTGLDTRTQAEVLGLLRELKTRLRTAFLFISHHPGVLAGLADRVLVMYAGRIVEDGELACVFANPLHPYTRGLLGSMPEVRAGDEAPPKRRLAPIAGNPPDPCALPRGCAFAPRCPARMEICSEQEPPEHAAEGARRVRCHLEPTGERAAVSEFTVS